MPVRVNALDHLVINVSDVARSTEWYRKILGMEVKVFDPGPGKTPRTSLVFGNQKINVRPRDADKVESRTSRRTALRSRKARSPSKAPAARCAWSIAGTPM